jgi:peroxiredoxin
VVVVFYRGGWCPFCNLQMRSLQTKVLPKLAPLHASIVAISVDLPTEGRKTQQKDNLAFRVVSDPKAKLLDAYKVKYAVPADLVAKYKAHAIDLEAASGEKHHVIAVPAVYVIDAAGKIVYRYVDENYKVRAPEADIIAAAAKSTKNAKPKGSKS